MQLISDAKIMLESEGIAAQQMQDIGSFLNEHFTQNKSAAALVRVYYQRVNVSAAAAVIS